MKFKNKGRKIYKTKEKNYYGKSPAGKFFSVALSALLIGGIGFIGYSIAEPIINYTKKQGDSSVPDESEHERKTTEDGLTDTTPGTTVNVQENTNIEQYRAVSIPTSALTDVSALRNALAYLPSGADYEYIEIPLKAAGGRIYYASAVNEAQVSGAVSSYIELDDIVAEINAAGYKASARISMFEDSVIPQSYPQMGYVTDQSGQQWIDNALESGGKPWVTPFSDDAVQYLRAIAEEVASADFDKVICSDFVFPYFRDSDLSLLGEDVNSSDRYLSLTSAANAMYNTILSGGSTMMLEISVADIIKDNAEVIQPMLLDVNNIILNVDIDELSAGIISGSGLTEFTGTTAEKAVQAVGLVQDTLSDFNVSVRFSGINTPESELIDAQKKIADEYGYTSYTIG